MPITYVYQAAAGADSAGGSGSVIPSGCGSGGSGSFIPSGCGSGGSGSFIPSGCGSGGSGSFIPSGCGSGVPVGTGGGGPSYMVVYARAE